MSWEASTHALGLTLGSATRKLVLMGYANHAHADGTAAFPALSKIAEYAECDVRTVQRHVKWLVENGYMREGDQDLVSHYAPRKRPIVYDVAMSEAARVEWEVYHAAGGNARRRAAEAQGNMRSANPQVKTGDKMSPQNLSSNDTESRGDKMSPQIGESRGDTRDQVEVTKDAVRGDTGVTQTTQVNLPLEPSSSFGDDALPIAAPSVADAAPVGAAETEDGSTSKPASKKGTRIPEHFPVTDDMKAWVTQHAPLINGWHEHEKFCDHWKAQPGQRGVKLDWEATWRNWMRKAQEDAEYRLSRRNGGNGQARNYRDADVWGTEPQEDDPAANMSEEEIAAFFAQGRQDRKPSTGTDG